MIRELSATSVSEVLPLITSKSLQSDANDSVVSTTLCPIRCRFSNKVGQYLWLINGSQLDIISMDPKNVAKQRLFGCFDFANVFNDNKIKILNVLQLMDAFETNSVNSKYVYTLIVSLRLSSGTCLICLIDVRLSLILKTIETPFKITSLEIISSNRSNHCNNWPLITELLQMNGILAIGTEGGLVFLMDLFLDFESPMSEALIPKKMSFIVFNSSHLNLKSRRKTASLHDQLISLPLNSDSQHKNRFIYKADDGSALSAFPKGQVFVSALQYIPQTAMLCIGFNFGGFQFYNLKTFKLECSCGLEYGLAPVVRFAFQDPENDPKNHSYVWVIRGQEIEDNSSSESDSSQQYFNTVSNAIMYSISFDTKEWISDYGILYTGFQGCSCRFEYILGPNPHFPESNILFSSRVIDCYPIPLGNYSSHKSSDDESVNLDLSLLFIAWEAMSDSSETNSWTYFTIFDLNQWYRSQMPTNIKTMGDKGFSPFLGVFSMIDMANTFAPDAILSVKIIADSITKFRSQSFQDDIHYYPSSLSFDVSILTESQICNASYLGLPKRCLAQMVSRGSSLLIDPKEYVNSCVISGLLSYDLLQNTHSVQVLREIVLTVALENECLPFLLQVIKDWASGELTHCGCDSKFILEWIWKRVSIIKTEIDSITYPLFNFSGLMLDKYNLSQLYAFGCDLKSLNSLLKKLQTSGAPTTGQGLQELRLRSEVTEMIELYLRTLLWFYEINLLPEHSEEDAFGEREVAYPSSKFKVYYTQRRKELHEMNPNVIRGNDLLLIDGMVESLNPSLSSLWIKGGGDGLYPPPNLHSLLGIFLLESVSLAQKQALMLYSLLDLADFLSDRQSDIVEKIRLFPQVFGLKACLIKMVQGFWGLDHKLFDFALRFLLDPVVKPLQLGTKDNEILVFNDLQQRIVTSFLYQNEVKSALMYSQNCGQFALDTPLREKLHLTILLFNQQISKAFQYQRLCRNESNATELLYQLFECCENMGSIEELFKIPLDQFEEEVLSNYLLTSEAPNAKQMLVLYLILNNKIIDASNLVNEYREELTNIADKGLAEKTKQLMVLINAYVSALPQSLTNLAKEITEIEKKKLNAKPKIIVSEVIPIQIKAKPLGLEWVAPSNTIENIMEQIADIWSKEQTKTSTPVVETNKCSRFLLCQNSPFLRTPTTDYRSAKKDIYLTKAVYPTPKSVDFNTGSALKHKNQGRGSVGLKTKTRGKQAKNAMNCSQDLLSILETPQINRKSSNNKTKSNVEMSSDNYFTPTSILKVKQLMRRSTSPSSLLPSPVSTRNTIVKTLESTPLQQKLRFCVPEKENSFTEDSVENARLTSTKDTLMLKTLRTSSQREVIMEESKQIDDSDLIDLETTAIDETLVNKTLTTKITKASNEEQISEHHFVFSPPQTRSSARKTNQKLKTDVKVMDTSKDKPIYLFSHLEEQKKTPKQMKAKTKPKKEKDPKSEAIEQSVPEETTSLAQQLLAEPMVRETPSRSPTPTSYVDDSDSRKSDTSQVSSSKASTRSSRSSKTPTKKVPKSAETPTHSMRLRTSSSKTKK